MRSESLYFRATGELRQAVDEYSANQGVTLSAALGALVERGLEAVSNEEAVRRIQAELEQRRGELAGAQLKLAPAGSPDNLLQEREGRGQLFRTVIVPQL